MPGRILYATFATPQLSGGVDVHRQHVGMLRAAGIEASLWLREPGTPAWMGEVPVVAGRTLEVGEDDLVIFPEAPIVPGVDPAPGARKVIFNENHFYTYATWDGPLDDYPGWSPAPAVWAVSEESADVLRALNPALPVTLVPAPVDPTLFAPAAHNGSRPSASHPAVPSGVIEPVAVPNLTRQDASARAALLHVDSYDVVLDLTDGGGKRGAALRPLVRS